MLVFRLIAFAALAGGSPEASGGFDAGALLVVVLMLAQGASLVGLFLARRWAVILGALSFKLSIFNGVGVEALWMALSVIPLALFLLCTLPYWDRMTWRLP